MRAVAVLLLCWLAVAASAKQGRKLRGWAMPVPPPAKKDLNMPDIKMPEMKMPDMKIPEVKMPDMKISDMKMPEMKPPVVVEKKKPTPPPEHKPGVIVKKPPEPKLKPVVVVKKPAEPEPKPKPVVVVKKPAPVVPKVVVVPVAKKKVVPAPSPSLCTDDVLTVCCALPIEYDVYGKATGPTICVVTPTPVPSKKSKLYMTSGSGYDSSHSSDTYTATDWSPLTWESADGVDCVCPPTKPSSSASAAAAAKATAAAASGNGYAG